MRILHVIPSLTTSSGGPARNTVALCLNLQKLGHHATIATTDALTPARAVKARAGATLTDFPPGAKKLDVRIFPLRRPYSFAFSPELRRFLRRDLQSYDVIHIHSVNLYPQYASWMESQRLGVPIILSPRGALDPWIRSRRRVRKKINDALWQRRMLDGVDAIHFTTEDEKDLLEESSLRAPKVVIPNAFSVTEFSSRGQGDIFRRRWLEGYSGPLVLNHGRLSEKKGLDILLDAIAVLHENQEVRLALVGADDEGIGSQLQAQALALGIENIVTIVPVLTGTDLQSSIEAADVWVLPSHTENFGMAVVEAMAAGKSIVTSPHVNIAAEAAMADALVMVPNTPEEVANAIHSLLGDSQRRQKLGRRAAEYVWRYDWSNVAQEFVMLYENVIDRHHNLNRN